MIVEADAVQQDLWEIAVDVRDTGIGIPPDRMDRLFRSFSQVDATSASNSPAFAFASARSRASTFCCASTMFSVAVICGNSA